jgi:Sulfotransferase family
MHPGFGNNAIATLADGRQFVFIHVPKTAGTSIGQAIWSAGQTVEWRPRYHAPAYTVLDGREDCFSCAFVRNPWDRMLSIWRFSRPDIALRDYIRNLSLEARSASERPYINVLGKSQSWFINDHAGKSLVSFIGRFESLHQDFGAICSEIGIAVPPLGHFNRTDHTNYRDYYDAETREMIAKEYAEDIEAFGYSF